MIIPTTGNVTAALPFSTTMFRPPPPPPLPFYRDPVRTIFTTTYKFSRYLTTDVLQFLPSLLATILLIFLFLFPDPPRSSNHSNHLSIASYPFSLCSNHNLIVETFTVEARTTWGYLAFVGNVLEIGYSLTRDW